MVPGRVALDSLRREVASWRAARRQAGGRFATAARLQHHAGTEALRDSMATEIERLERRIDHLLGLIANQDARASSHAESIDALRARPVDAITPTMAWVEQATLATTPLVSVVLPTRNRAQCLPTAIASVLAQTYPRWELLIVDDGSEDETAELLASLSDPRLRTLSLPHGGVSAARNAGLELAEGEIVAYIDDDNTMHPAWLKSVVWGFEQRPDVDVLYGAYVIDDLARTRKRGSGDLPTLWLHPYRRDALAEANLADMSAIAHRAGLPEARFDESLVQMGDWDLLARLTTETDPLVLPAIACFYSTHAPHRLSGGPTQYTDAAVVRRRAREARGLDSPADGAVPASAGTMLRSLLDDGPPLSFGDWALGPAALEVMLKLVDGVGAGVSVVECGSGESTIAIGRLLRRLGGGRLYSLEHHPAWAAEVRGRIAAEELDEFVELLEAPLSDHPLAPPGHGWYELGSLAALPKRIDVLLVDGPPTSATGAERARYPALAVLGDRLAPGAAVILDDIGREGERWVLERWQAEHRIKFELRVEDGVAIGVSCAPTAGEPDELDERERTPQ